MLFRLDPFQTTAAQTVSRVESPTLADAPEAVAEEEAPPEEAKAEDGGDEEDKAPAEKKEPEEESGPPVPASNDLWLTVPKLGLYDVYVANDDSTAALDAGAAKLPSTEFPWQEGANTYIAGHRLGWPGTGSDHIFYNLPLLAYGDKIYLTDANGTTYTYEVSEIIEVDPSEGWVTGAVGDRDIVSLQTCIENYGDYWTMGPNWFARYVVRADRVTVDEA